MTLLACSSARHTIRDGKFVFSTFLNLTGWPDGVAWMMGLLQTQYSLVGADGAAHLVNEIKNPRRNAPRAMIISCIMGGSMAFIVLLAFVASTTDPVSVAEAQGGGYMLVILQGMGNAAGATAIASISLGK